MSDNSLTPPKSIRARSSQRSIIRKLLKLASQPDVISFAGGLPSPKSFPVKAIEKATDWVLETEALVPSNIPAPKENRPSARLLPPMKRNWVPLWTRTAFKSSPVLNRLWI